MRRVEPIKDLVQVFTGTVGQFPVIASLAARHLILAALARLIGLAVSCVVVAEIARPILLGRENVFQGVTPDTQLFNVPRPRVPSGLYLVLTKSLPLTGPELRGRKRGDPAIAQIGDGAHWPSSSGRMESFPLIHFQLS